MDDSIKNQDIANFDFVVFDLYTGVEKDLQECIYALAERLNQPKLKGPLYSMLYEMTVNGLKAMYKQIYYKYFVEELGLDDVPYEDWLKLFKTEIEAHQAENFARFCRERNMFVKVHGKTANDAVIFEVVNDGVPSEIEFTRLKNCIERAKKQDGPAFLFEDDDSSDGQKEGGGLGINLIIMTLRNLGINPDNYVVTAEGEQTFARLHLPLAAISGAN